MKKRILSIFLAALMITTSFVFTASAEDTSEFAPVDSFSIDFEDYGIGTAKAKAWYYGKDYTGTNSTHDILSQVQKGTYTGNAAWTLGQLKYGAYPYKYAGEAPIVDDTDGYQYPETTAATHKADRVTSEVYDYYNYDSFEFGGLDDYIGFTSFMAAITNKAMSTDLRYMNVMDFSGMGRVLNMRTHDYKANYIQSSYFGKNVNIVNKITKTKFDINVRGAFEAANATKGAYPGFRINLVENADWAAFKSNLSTKFGYQYLNDKYKGNWYDALTFYNGNIYLGDITNAANVICTYETQGIYTVEYILDTTDMAAPKNAVVIYNADGTVRGYKDLAEVTFTYSTIGRKSTTIDETSQSTINNSYTTPHRNRGKIAALSADNTYTLLLSNHSGGNFIFIDNFSFEETNGISVNAEAVVASGSSKTTVSATIANFGSSASTAGKFIVAAYDKATNAMLSVGYADAASVEAGKVGSVITVDMADYAYNSSTDVLYCYYWDGFDKLVPIADKTKIN